MDEFDRAAPQYLPGALRPPRARPLPGGETPPNCSTSTRESLMDRVSRVLCRKAKVAPAGRRTADVDLRMASARPLQGASVYFSFELERTNESRLLFRRNAGRPPSACRHLDGERFILNYWTPPLHISADDPDPTRAKYGWCPDADSVMAFLAMHQAKLKDAGYTHTIVPDSRVTAYSSRSAAIDVIWSRRRDDETEIERLALHFEVRRDNPNGSWGIIAISGQPTDTERLDDAWIAIQR
jgi:hypothetical protein